MVPTLGSDRPVGGRVNTNRRISSPQTLARAGGREREQSERQTWLKALSGNFCFRKKDDDEARWWRTAAVVNLARAGGRRPLSSHGSVDLNPLAAPLYAQGP